MSCAEHIRERVQRHHVMPSGEMQQRCRDSVYRLPPEQAAMTPKDHNLLRSFRALCRVDQLEEFCSDDFRMYGLDRFIADKQHGIGGFFAKLKVNGFAEEVGWRRSVKPENHGRRIRVYRWKVGGGEA